MATANYMLLFNLYKGVWEGGGMGHGPPGLVQQSDKTSLMPLEEQAMIIF